MVKYSNFTPNILRFFKLNNLLSYKNHILKNINVYKIVQLICWVISLPPVDVSFSMKTIKLSSFKKKILVELLLC